MKPPCLASLLLGCAVLTLPAGPLQAQDGSGEAPEGAIFLLLPVGARAVAMGRAMTALRLATIVVGAVVANHLFSAVDAFVSSRLSAAETVSVTSNVRARGGGHTLEWQVQLRP